jgi:plasmid stability protein
MVPKWNQEEDMVTITVKNVPEEIYERIKLQAKANRRSINSEIIAIFEMAIPKRTAMNVNEILERARQVRELTAHYTAGGRNRSLEKEGRE